MLQGDRINISSLNVVSDELIATIEQAANKLEQFVSTPEQTELLQESIAAIEQVRGTLQLIQFKGAALLAEAICAAARAISQSPSEPQDKLLDVLTSAFFILPRYLEYSQQTRNDLPILLIPYINELRVVTGYPLLGDAHFLDLGELNQKPQLTAAVNSPQPSDRSALLKRIRHMYQVGLVNALQGKQLPAALGVMERALERLELLSSPHPRARLWFTASAGLAAIRTSRMELSKSRKTLLMSLDREIKKSLMDFDGMLDVEPSAPQLKEFLFLCALTTDPLPKVKTALDGYGLSWLGFTDQELSREREALRGPSLNTVASVAAVLQDEVRSIKEILENASLASDKGLADYADLTTHLIKVSDILALVGLVSAGHTLKQEISKIEQWQQDGKPATADGLAEVADSLLYVESTIAGLDGLNLSSDKLTQVNAVTRREIVASSQLAEAESLVIQEAEAGLALVKRALSSFVESNFDTIHIKNVPSTLTTIRGGMMILNRPRAARVVAACSRFIEETLLHGDKPAALQQQLETFADTVIALDYYLDAVMAEKSSDDSVLAVAEESLKALGFPVAV